MSITITETHNINLSPSEPTPVYHASQGDVGRRLRFYMYNRTSQFYFSGDEIITLKLTRPDGVTVTKSVTNPGSTSRTLTITTNAQMTALPGKCNGEISLEVENESGPNSVIGTCNFILDVEVDPLYNKSPGDSQINTLDKQVEEMVLRILGE
jgi:hypothetical protein